MSIKLQEEIQAESFKPMQRKVNSRRKFFGRHHPKISHGAIVIVVDTAVGKVQVKYKGEKFWVPSCNIRYISKRTHLSNQDLDFVRRASPFRISEY